jgi:hypothetical protein
LINNQSNYIPGAYLHIVTTRTNQFDCGADY